MEECDNKRKSRNASEKKRRDQFNILVTELGAMVQSSPGREPASGHHKHHHGNGGGDVLSKRVDKTTVLKNTISYLKKHQQTANSKGGSLGDIREDWKPSELSNEEFSHLMLESSEGFILVLDAHDGRIQFVSENIASILGFQMEEFEGKIFYEFLHREDRSKVSFNEDVENADIRVRRRKRVVLADDEDDDEEDDDDFDTGEEFEEVELSGNCCIRDGKCYFVSVIKLRNVQLLREIPMSMSNGTKNEFTSRYSLEWKILQLDQRASNIIGYLPIELLGHSGYDYYHFDDLERISRCHESLMQTGEVTSCYHRFLTKGQQWIWLQTRYYISYHQWISKPEFVVATHRVVNYADVLKGDGDDSRVKCANESETGSATEGKSTGYPPTASPSWSSKCSYAAKYAMGESEETFEGCSDFEPVVPKEECGGGDGEEARMPPPVCGAQQQTAKNSKDDLKKKQLELQKQIARQQEELRRLSQQLEMIDDESVPEQN